MSSTPHGWKLLKLRDIATLKTGPFGSALHKADYIVGGIPLINPTHIKDGKLAPSIDVSVSPETAERLSDYQLNKGDIVMGRRGEMGRCAVVPEHAQDWLCGTGSVVVKSTFAAHPKYLQRFLTAPATVAALIGDSVGSTMINLNQGVLLGLDIPLAPLPEQKRIADKLDSVLARVDACRDRLDRLPALLKRFRQSILAAATSGRLTEDWRSGKSPSWEDCKLGDLLKGKPRNGYSPKAVDYCTPVKSLTLSATTSGKFKSEHIKFIDESIPADSHLWLKPNDILIQRANTLEYVGVSAIFQEEAGQYIYPDLMMKCEANQKVLPEFLLFTLSTESTRTYFRENATGTAGNMPKINQQTVINAPALLPPFGEQTEIVRRVELLFAFADRLETRLAAARRQVGQLTPAFLAKAFRGELVPQDPADEPAAELLKRLATQREAAPKTRRGRAGKA